MANIKDISRLSGCSKSTVSRYLNNGSVSDETAEKIKKVIDELNYTPNSFARSLKASKSYTIGTIIPNFIGFAKNISLTAIDNYLKKNSYEMYISNSNDNTDDEIRIINSMANQKMDGIILFASKITEEHYEAIKGINIPVVVIGQELEGIHCVIHDDFKAGRLIGEYLLSSSHKKIAYYGVGEYDKSVKKRYLGMMSVLDDSFEIDYKEVGFNAESSYEMIKNTYSPEHTFYVGATDNISFGIMRGLREFGLSIPEDISISGFGDYEMDLFVNPNLTTVHFSYEEAGRKAAEMILDIIEGEDVEKTNLLDCEFKLRESTIK